MTLVLPVALGLASLPVFAFSLGPISVLSIQGEPLQAEIDLADISSTEASSLKAGLASVMDIRAAGIQYDPALSDLQVTLKQRPNGQSFLDLRGNQPLPSSFVDLVLEISWSSGRMLREYTLLLKPALQPVASEPTPVPQPTPPAQSQASATPLPRLDPTPSIVAPAAPTPAVRAPAETISPAPRPAARTVVVRVGDTAGQLVADHIPANISLDQMLLALLRTNPEAFINNNINLLKAGAVLTMPDVAKAEETTPQEARRIIVAQSRDFNEYRRKLAGQAPRTAVDKVRREISGAVNARVEDKKSESAPADKLTLSKGAIQGKTREDQISEARNEAQTAQRASELEKNINELKKLSADLAQQASQPAASQASTPAITASEVAAQASVASSPASEPAAPASAPVVVAATASPASVPQIVASDAMPTAPLIDEFIDNPLSRLAGAGLLTLLLLTGWYRMRQRRKASPFDTVLAEEQVRQIPEPSAPAPTPVPDAPELVIEPTLEPEPKPVQPEVQTAQPMDPVTEAEAYLAYGRDRQAEEILRKGLESEPDRVAIHMKLLDIFAKQMDVESFEATARDVNQLTGGAGENWDKVCAQGISIDPDNSLYQSHPVIDDEPVTADEADWPIEEEPVTPAPAPATEMTLEHLDLDLDAFPDTSEQPAQVEENARTGESGLDNLDFNTLTTEPAASQESEPEEEEKPPRSGTNSDMLTLDLSSISLDLEEPEPASTSEDNPLNVKLALAEEFHAIGDTDGARALIEEVLGEATGDIRIKAEEALKKLG